MSAWWLNILLIITFSTSVNSKFDLDSRLALARCRASCLYKMQISRTTDLECRRSFNCSECWEACVALKGRSPLCAPTDCGPGCLEACRLPTLSPNHRSPVLLEELLVFNDSTVSWPSVSDTSAVFVVMAARSQLCQTLDTSAPLPSHLDTSTVRVLVVDWRGLVKVLAPVAESPLDQALHILRNMGMEDKLGLMLNPTSEFKGSLMNSSTPQVSVQRVWRLNVESLDHDLSLVLAKISWRSHHHQLLNNQLTMTYLVTWSEDGGFVRGNLLTNTPAITLSLLPDTLYRIQVSVLGTRSSKLQSEFLELDTRRVYSKSLNSSSLQRMFESSETLLITPINSDIKAQEERLEGVTVLVLVFLGLIVVSAWRWRCRNSSSKGKLLNARIDSPRLNRVLPTTRRVFANAHPTEKEFSSTENLLQTSYVSH